MPRSRFFPVLGCMLLAAALPSVAQFQGPPQTNPVSPALTGPQAPADTPPPPGIKQMAPFQTVKIRPGDQLEINILGVTQPAPSVQVSGFANSQNTASPIHQVVNADGIVQVSYIGAVDT